MFLIRKLTVIRFLKPRWLKGPSTQRLIAIALGMICWLSYSWLLVTIIGSPMRLLYSGFLAWWPLGITCIAIWRFRKYRSEGNVVKVVTTIGVLIIVFIAGNLWQSSRTLNWFLYRGFSEYHTLALGYSLIMLVMYIIPVLWIERPSAQKE